MGEENKDGTGAKPVEDVAQVMQSLKDEYEARLAKKDEEITTLKNKHATEIRDIMLGRSVKAKEEKNFDDVVKETAKKIRKNLGL